MNMSIIDGLIYFIYITIFLSICIVVFCVVIRKRWFWFIMIALFSTLYSRLWGAIFFGAVLVHEVINVKNAQLLQPTDTFINKIRDCVKRILNGIKNIKNILRNKKNHQIFILLN